MHKRGILSWLLVFWAIWLISGSNIARAQTDAWVTVSDTSLESGKTRQMVTVFLVNDVPIRGIELMFTLGRPLDTDFTTDWIELDTLSSPGDTFVIRHCKLDTSGSLVKDFEWLEAHGEAGDPAYLDCDWVKVAGMAQDGQPILPGSGVLFRLYVDVLCIPDTTLDRMAWIFVTGKLSDPDGFLVETDFANGTILIDRTVCDTLLECTCGDVNADGNVGLVDIVYMINWMFKGGSDFCPPPMGDVDLNRGVGLSDIVYLINYLFQGGADPDCTRYY